MLRLGLVAAVLAGAAGVAFLARRNITYHAPVNIDGIGFEPSQAEELFTPFVRGASAQDSTSVEASRGTGLGLAIARELALKMGGELSGSSEGLGKGATFSLGLLRSAGEGSR